MLKTRSYPISDKWLRSTDPNAPEYCDIFEIRNDPGSNVGQPDNTLQSPVEYPSCAYLDWVLANDPGVFTKIDGSNPSRKDHIIAASFTDSGCRVGDIDDGNNIRGIFKDNSMITTGEYSGGIVHDDTYRRIYRVGTEVEKFWFLGY